MYVCTLVCQDSAFVFTDLRDAQDAPARWNTGGGNEAEGMTVCEPRQWHTVIP